MLPGGEHVEAPLAGSLPLQDHGPSRHHVAPAASRAGCAAQSTRERTNSDFANLLGIFTDSTLSQLRRLGLYRKAFLTGFAHQNHQAKSVVKYACATADVQTFSVREKTEIILKEN